LFSTASKEKAKKKAQSILDKRKRGEKGKFRDSQGKVGAAESVEQEENEKFLLPDKCV
jgi:hypothetical protein